MVDCSQRRGVKAGLPFWRDGTGSHGLFGEKSVSKDQGWSSLVAIWGTIG